MSLSRFFFFGQSLCQDLFSSFMLSLFIMLLLIDDAKYFPKGKKIIIIIIIIIGDGKNFGGSLFQTCFERLVKNVIINWWCKKS